MANNPKIPIIPKSKPLKTGELLSKEIPCLKNLGARILSRHMERERNRELWLMGDLERVGWDRMGCQAGVGS